MDKYYTVVYLSDGTIHMWPGDTQDECLATAARVRDKNSPTLKDGSFIVATTVIKRDLDSFKTVKDVPMIFGSPKTLDAMQSDFKYKKK